MKTIVVDLHISADEYRKMYAGLASKVSARSRDGRRIQFPANVLRQFVDMNGVSGSFEFVLDENNKLQQFRRL